jgi:hypothetical protein
MTFEFPVLLNLEELSALQDWKDRNGIASRSKAVRLLAMIGLNTASYSSTPPLGEGNVPFNIRLPAELYRQLQLASHIEGITISQAIIDRLRRTMPSAGTEHPPGSRDRTSDLSGCGPGRPRGVASL